MLLAPSFPLSHIFTLRRGSFSHQASRHCVRAVSSTRVSSSSMSQQTGPRRLVLWFRNDLRLRDNYMVEEALMRLKAKEVDDVVPVYCFDPRLFKSSQWGNVKTGAHRAKFLMESAEDLKESLMAVGSNLLVTVGLPEEVIKGVAEGSSSCTVLTQQEVTSEELAADAKVTQALAPWKGQLRKVWGSTLFHLEDVAGPSGALGPMGIRGLPDIFTPFKDKVERKGLVRKEAAVPKAGDLPLPAGTLPLSADRGGVGLSSSMASFPSWEQLPWATGTAPAPPVEDSRAVLQFKGGEKAALARLKYYLWEKDLLATYFETRNGMLGGDYSTKLAPWLAAGCISPRTIYHQIKLYETQRVANKSTYWFFSMKHGNRIFLEGGTTGQMLTWTKDPELFQRWREGRTGLPLVDANMRELAATGFMSNRGRQNVASYLVLDLGVDWRRGADYFEHVLLDYDVGSNWGNWVSMAGLTGGRVNHFNISKQSKDYDLEGDYVRTWLPELRNVPKARIHEPWLMSRDEQAKYGVQIGVDYPSPVPAAKLGRPYGGGAHGGGGRGGGTPYGSSSSGSRPSSAASSGRGSGRQFSNKKSEYDRFG